LKHGQTEIDIKLTAGFTKIYERRINRKRNMTITALYHIRATHTVKRKQQ